MNKAVFGHYAEALTRIHEQGYYATVKECYSPYLNAVSTNFDPKTDTVTEKVASGRAFEGLLGKVRKWFGRKKT